MKTNQIKFKPLGAKVIHAPNQDVRLIVLDYIYQNGVYTISKEISEKNYFVLSDLSLDLVLLYFGGFKAIEEKTLKLINEEISES